MTKKHAGLAVWAVMLAVFGLGAALGQAQVVLFPPTPASVAAGGGVSMRARAFPAGTIAAADVAVTLTPSSGGASVTTAASELLHAPGGYMILFSVPRSIAVSAPTPFTVTVAGSTTTATTFTTATSAALTVLPPASLTGPATTVTAGQSVPLTVNGAFSHFGPSSALSVSPAAGITISNVQVASTTQLTATVAVASGVLPSLRSLTVTTGAEVASGANLLEIQAPAALAPVLSSASPSSLQQGAASVPVTITGQNLTGATFSFSDGVTGPTSSISADGTTASLDVSVPGNAAIGAVSVAATTAGGTISGNLLSITAGTPVLASIDTASLQQGASGKTVNLSGQYLSGATFAFSDGITATVASTTATSAQLSLSVPSGATIGAVTITATSSDATVQSSGSPAFKVTAGTPVLASIDTASLQQGASGKTVNLSGQYLSGATFAFSDGITATVASTTATSAQLSLSVPSGATIGPVTITATSSDATVNGSSSTLLSVTAGTPTITAVSPVSLPIGASAQPVTVTGQYLSGAAFTYSTGVSGTLQSINGAGTSATLSVTVSGSAPVGTATITATTAGGSAGSGSLFSVTAGGPVLSSASPASLQQGAASVPVTITGQNLTAATFSFSDGVTGTTSNISADGTTASLELTVPSSATLGAVSVTATTAGGTISGNLLSVTAGTPVLTSIDTASLQQGASHQVVITGQYLSGATFAFGDGITVTPVSSTATSATLGLSVLSGATIGAVAITATSSDATAHSASSPAFKVTAGTPVLASIDTASLQQGESHQVVISGNYLSGATFAFGDGITVTSTTTTATTATLGLSVPAAAVIGPVAITATSSDATVQSASSPAFKVTAGTPVLASIDTASLQQGVSGKTVNLSGQYLSGATFAFTDGVTATVANTTASSAQLSMTVPSGATIGAVTITATSSDATVNGSSSTLLSVTAGTPTITAVSPASLPVGASAQPVTVTGQYLSGATFTYSTGVSGTLQSINGAGTSATLSVTVSGSAPVGTATITAGTAGGSAGSGTLFSVTAGGPVLSSASPASLQQGAASVPVTVTGQNLTGATFSFGDGVTGTTSSISADGTTASLDVSVPANAAIGAVSVTATTAGGTISANLLSVTAGTPVLASIDTASLQQGASGKTVNLSGQYLSGATFAFSDGITVTVTSTTATSAQLSLSVPSGAAIGPVAITATSSDATAHSASSPAFKVTAGTPVLASIDTASLQQGESHQVVISGSYLSGATFAFGDGITVTSTTTTATTATLGISVPSGATIGAVTITATSSDATVQSASSPAFKVTAGTPVLSGIDTASLQQGASGKTVNLSGQYLSGATFAFTDGVTATVASTTATSAQLSVTVPFTATVGAVTITATSSDATVTGTSSTLFSVTASAASLSSVSPAAGTQNQSNVPVTITGSGTHFTQAAPVVSFGAGVTVSDIVVNSDTSLSVKLSIANDATPGARTVTVSTGGEVVSLASGFTVTAGTAVLVSSTPATLHQNDSNKNLTITGQFTNFVNGTTSGSFSPADITVNSVTVTDSTDATVNVTVSPSATLGSHTLTLTTNSENAVGTGIITVLAGQAQVASVSPDTGAQGSTQTLTITGLYTNFQPGVSTVSISGNNLSLGAVTVNGPQQLQVPVTVIAPADATPRDVTVTTGSEVATLAGAFTVLPGQPSITIIHPNVGVPNSSNVSVTITGLFTHFTSGGGTPTVAKFGAGIAVGGAAEGAFGPVTVNSPTTATAVLSIDAAATLGARDVTVQTGSELLFVNSGFTVQSTSPTAPQVAYISPAYTATNVPTNTSVTLGFTAPLDRTTVTLADVGLVPQGQSCNFSTYLPAALSVDASGRIVTLVPASVLSVGQLYYICLNQNGTGSKVKDPSGNQVVGNYWYFTTGFNTDTSGPSFTYANIANNATGIGTNAPVTLGFNKPIDPNTVPGAFIITSNGVQQTGTFGYNQDYTQVTFTPTTPWTANTAYTVEYTDALTDSVGTPLANPGSFSFTTGASTDTGGTHFISWTPRTNETTGTNPVIEGVLSGPVNPLSINPSLFYVLNTDTSVHVLGTTISFSPDHTIVYLALSGPLDSYTHYEWVFSGSDPAGYGISGDDVFYTGAGAITAPPTVVTETPLLAATGVSLNPAIQIQYSGALDWTSVANSVSISPNISGTSTLASDNETVTFTPSGNLAVGTPYTVTVAGLRDTQGNAVPSFSWSFTTGATATVDNTAGTIVSMTPPSTATGTVVLTLSKPVNPVSVTTSSAYLYDQTASSSTLPGEFVPSADGLTLTYTPPSGGFPSGDRICTYISEIAPLNDLSGNRFQAYSQCFTAPANTTTTAPSVIAVTPSNGATAVGPNAPVTVTFSEPMTHSLLNGHNVALYAGSKLYNNSISVSSDNTSLTFSTSSLPYNTTFTIVVNPGVTDLYGNALQQQFSSTFTTVAQPDGTRPSVIAFRPGSGATGVNPSTVLTFFMSEPIDPSTVAGALEVAQNGVLVSGSVAVSADDQVITFTPQGPFSAGANVSAWLYDSLTDASGNPLNTNPYNVGFTVAKATVGQPPQLLNLSISTALPANGVIDALFDQPMDPTTAAANFTVNSGAVTGSVTELENGTLLRFTPDSALTVHGSVCVNLGSGLKSLAGIAFAGTGTCYSATAADNTPLTVTGFAPTDGSSAIGVNAIIRVTFNKPAETGTVTPSTLTLTSGGVPIPYTYSVSGSTTLTLTPQAPLPASAAIKVAVTAGVDDFTGASATPASATFQTGPAPVYSTPVVIGSTIQNGATNVPVNADFSVTFDRAMDTRSFNTNSVYMNDNAIGGTVPGAITFTPDGRTLTFKPNAPLAINRSYTWLVTGVTDLTGNTSGTFVYLFTTAVSAAAGGPQVVYTTPRSGASNEPVNLLPEVEFNRPIARGSLAGLQLLDQNSTPVPYSPLFSDGDTVVTLSLEGLLNPNSSYTLSIAGITDTGGTPMASPVTAPFSTGAGMNLIAPVIVSYTPISGAITGTNPVIRVQFNEPVDPIASNGAYLTNYGAASNAYVPVTMQFSPDRTVMTIHYVGTLQPNSRYNWGIGTVYDDAGYSVNGSNTFTTGAGVDSTNPAVTSSTPPNAATAVPLNAVIALQLSQPIDPITVNNSSLTLSPAVAGAVSLSSDGLTLTFTPSAPLASGQNYTINASGFADLNGNLVTPFTSTFTTGSAAITTTGTTTFTTPGNGAANVSQTAAVVVHFSQPVNPNSISTDALLLEDASGNQFAGSLSLSGDRMNLSFTPSVPLPANAAIHVYANYYGDIKDLAGNGYTGINNDTFTTGSGTAAVAPQVVMVTPNDGTSGVGPNAVVTLQFNEALTSSTISAVNFALYNGYTKLSASIGHSADYHTITLTAALPYASTITVAVSNAITGLDGTAMAASFYASFTTTPAPLYKTPNITQMRPGNGASGVPVNSAITLYASAPIASTTLTGNVVIAQNGVAVQGSLALTSSGQAIVFTPNANLPAGTLIQVFASSGLTDTAGDPFSTYSASFHTQADLTTTVASLISSPQNASNNPTNTGIVLVFNKPIDFSTVNSGNFYVSYSNSPVAATITNPEPNVLRLQPTSALPASAGMTIELGTGIKDQNGISVGGGGWGMNTAAGPDNTTPAVTAIVPNNGATNVGDNAAIRIVFSKPMDTSSINASTVTLTSGAQNLPYSLSFTTFGANNATVAILTPQAPLPDTAQVTVSLSAAVMDYEGHPITAQTAAFTVANGADFTAPLVVSQSPGSAATSVPVNTNAAWVFNEPVYPVAYSTYSNNSPSVTLTVSPDGKTVVLTPTAPLTASTQYQFCVTAADLAGNTASNNCINFTTASAPSGLTPQVLATTPVANGTNVAINTEIQVRFNEPLDASSLGQVTLTSGGNPVAATASLSGDGSLLQVAPSTLLAPNTAYTVTIAGVRDLGGNTIVSPYTFSFTTGPNPGGGNVSFNYNAPTVLVGGIATPLVYSGTLTNAVDDNTTITLTFTGPILGSYLLYPQYSGHTGVELEIANTSVTVPVSAVVAADGSTVTITPLTPLTAGTKYELLVQNNFSYIYDAEGYQVSNGATYIFTTQ